MPKGGPRAGSGRKPGARWNGSGAYCKKVRVSVGLEPKLYEWLRAEAEKHKTTMSELAATALREERGRRRVHR